MDDVSYPAILVAALGAFLLSFIWYAIFGAKTAELRDAEAAEERPPPWKLGVELVRSLVVAGVVAWLVARGEIDEWWAGALVGVCLWVGFPVVLLTGSVIWEKVPWRLAAIHGGDWLVKLVVIGAIVSCWQG
jgi:hypothetical protein